MNIKTSAAKILKCFSDAESIQRTKEQFSKKQEDIIFCIALQQDVQKHLMNLQNE